MMGLRLSEGVDMSRLSAINQEVPDMKCVSSLEELGLIECDGTTLRATSKGRPVLNAILRELLA
jgi:coproporphyrinogen III oxidase-like Fe-S oxidoreductase